MAITFEKFTNFRNSSFPLTNFHFDAGVAALAAISCYLQRTGSFSLGLQTFTFATIADRCILRYFSGDFRVPTQLMPLVSTLAKGIVYAAVDEGLYSYVLLTNQKGPFYTILRLVGAFFAALPASRSLRHIDPNNQDLKDAVLALGWAIGREIVIRKASPLVSTVVMLASNALIFGLIERRPYVDSAERNYKLLSGIAMRLLCDLSAMNLKTFQRESFIAPLTTHFLFNISRSFK